MTRIKAALTGAIFTLIALAIPGNRVFAATSLLFSPTTKNAAAGETFSVTVNINADTAAYGADAVVLYPPDDLEFVSASAGNFFDEFGYAHDANNGRIEIHANFEAFADAKAGSGTLVNLTFKSKNSTGGTGTITFLCTGDGNNTYILNPTGTNILSCTNTNSLSVVYQSATPTNTPVPAATGTPAPATNQTPDCVGISFLPTGSVTTMSKVTFTCQGHDNDGYLTGAEFDFGDGNTRIVTSLGGNNDRLVTEYRYVKTGAYGASCRVRDNSGAWSGTPAICKTVIKIAASSGYNPGQKTTTVKPTTKATPTVAVVPLETFVSPTALPPLPDIMTDEAGEDNELIEENPLQRILLYAGGGLLAVIILIAIVNKLRGPKINPPVINPPTAY